MNIKTINFLLLAFIISSVFCQDTSSDQLIKLDEVTDIKLGKGQTKNFTVTIKGLKSDQSLFIQAESPFYDPYQIPSIIVRSQDNFTLECSQEDNEYVGICQIESQKLSENKNFSISIKCYQQCSLKLSSFLSEIYLIPIRQKLQINALKTLGSVQQLKLLIPLDLTFTGIGIIVKILNQAQVNQGLNLYVNVGAENVTVPTAEKFDFRGRETWGSGIGVFLNKEQAKPGDWVKVYIVIGQGMNVEFSTQVINGNQFSVVMNSPYEDFTADGQTKLYVLDLDTKYNDTVKQALSKDTIEIIFVIYSGSPSIKVGFDQKLQTHLDNYDLQGTISYLISPDIRTQYNYTGKIYIQVSSYWSSDYSLFIYPISSKAYPLYDGISQLNRVQTGTVQNYIYTSLLQVVPNVSTIESYRVKVQILEGMAQVGVRRCHSMEVNNTLDCIITNLSDLQSDAIKTSFKEINVTVRRDWLAYELLFEYDASACQLYHTFGNISIYQCDFQIIVFANAKSVQQLVYSVTMYQNRQQATLKQGYSFKDFIYKETYHYYNFNLPVLDNIEEVTFFLTVISGDAGILGTTNQKWKYMELSDAFQQQDIIISFMNTLTFQKQEISNNFFIAVYGYDASEITISVIVKRKSQTNKTDIITGNSTIAQNTTNNQSTAANQSAGTNQSTTINQSTLYLTEALSQQYTLGKGYDYIVFSFTAKQAKNTTVEIIQIVGSINYKISKANSTDDVKCQNKALSGQQKCTFMSTSGSQYLLNISSIKQSVQTFSVSYFTGQNCKTYPLNLPQFVFLGSKSSQCSIFPLSDLSKSLQIISSFSTIDLLVTNVTFVVTFNDQHKIQFNTRVKQFAMDQLRDFCQSPQMNNCKMKVQLIGDKDKNVQFNFVVEQVGKEMALFDGIVRKVIDDKMSQTKGKFFYYEVGSKYDSIKIFATNRDSVGYYIGAKFIQTSSFQSTPDTLYLQYRNISQNTLQNSQNIFQVHLLAKKGTSIIQIEADQFKNYCQQCVMLVSVFGLQKKSDQANIFQLEVTQTESYIYLGAQKTGFLGEDQIYIYDVNANPDADSIITIRDLKKESYKEKDCFSSDLMQQQSQSIVALTRGSLIIKKSTKSYKLLIQNTSPQLCTFQVSYSSLTKPLTQLSPYMPSQIKLQSSSTKYFIYYHHQQSQFQVLNYLQSGDLRIYVNGIGINDTVQNLINRNVEMFRWKTKTGDSAILIDNKTKEFCNQCYYIIAIKGDPNVQAQLAIAKGDQPIGLATYALLKQSLSKGQVQQFSFYSIIDFNISLSILYGELQVRVISPDKTYVYNNTLTYSSQIKVSHPSSAQGQYIDYYDENSKFLIQITSIRESSFYIMAKRRNVAMRIYEGVPVVVQLEITNTTLEFININQQGNVSLIIQIKQQVTDDFVLQATSEVIRDGEQATSKLQILSIERSENSYNIVFRSIKGTYFITFAPKNVTVASILLAKTKLTHLMASSINLFVEPGTFQIYTPGQNIMIVVDSCKNEVQVKASEKYSQITNNNTQLTTDDKGSLLLQHANYGGHYVITVESVQGEYFLQVIPKKANEKMLYLISYFYYNKTDVMPYKKIDITPEINYEINSEQIKFSLSPVRKLATKSNFNYITTYTIYISNSSDQSSMNSKCGLDYGFSLNKQITGQSIQSVAFSIDLKTIQKQVGRETTVYYVSAKARIRFQDESISSNYPSYIDLAYTKTQVTQSHNTIQFKSQTTSNFKYIMMWVVLPLILTAVLLFFAFKFCIRKYRQLYPDQLVEEDRQYGESEGQMSDMKPNKSAQSN